MSRPGSSSFVINKRPTVSLFAEYDVLALSLLEKLLANFCRVKIFTDDLKVWQENTVHLAHAKFFSFVSPDAIEELEDSAYTIYVDLFPRDVSRSERFIRNVVKYASQNFIKTLLVLPYFLETENQKKIVTFVKTQVKNEQNFGVVYVGQIVSPRMVMHRGFLMSEVISDLERGDILKVPQNNFEVFPAFATDVARETVKSLFSFGYFGQEVAMYSAKTTFDNFLKFLKHQKKTKGFLSLGVKSVRLPGVDREVQLTKNLESFVPETIEWFDENPEGILSEIKASQVKKREKDEAMRPLIAISPRIKSFLSSRMFLWTVGIIALCLVAPILLLAIGVITLSFSYRLLESGNLTLAESASEISLATTGLSNKETNVLKGFPLLGVPYEEISSTGEIISDVANIATLSVSVAKESENLLKNILGKNSYNISSSSESLSLDLDVLYKDLSFLQGEISNLPPLSSRLIGVALQKIDLTQIRQQVSLGEVVANNLPQLLGVDKQTTYLVLLQNNMELRPTGGFIGSFALLTFDQGKLVDTNVSDVYSADGQLEGHVEPPAAIKNYLGQANWYLRDSNWDPDFPTSATRAEWFLGKEINKSVDGVFGIDLEFVRNLVQVTGPIVLPDFNQTISYSNLYEKTQTEVEENFFPGSQKKTNYLTALTRAILQTLNNPKETLLLGFSKEALSALKERHLQVFVHNQNVQNSISDMGWDGAVMQPVCDGNCYPDWFGLVDANVGVNKANYYINRNEILSVKFDNNYITRMLTVNYQNSANPALGSSGGYKDYLRILVPQGAEFADIQVTVGDKSETSKPEINDIQGRREVGVLVEIPAGQKASIKFIWQNPLSFSFAQPGEYRMYIRKQAGTIADKISFNILFPPNVLITTSPRFTLTPDQSLSYNTTLATDLFASSRW